MKETTVYDVYTDVDGVEELLGSYGCIGEAKKSVLNASKTHEGIIVKPEVFITALSIGDIERSANVRIEPRVGVV